MKTIYFKLFLAGLGLTIAMGSQAQEIQQTVKGYVIDEQSEAPLPGVNVYVDLGDEKKGAATDGNGFFKIESVPAGRVDVVFSFVGYAPVVLHQQELTGSKELVLNVEMREQAQQLEEATVKSRPEDERTNNERINVSGRSFSVAETKRYAGALQDVSRMASNFAGVQRTDDSNNDIVIRGNSPTGLIWRLEGMDIPNPNHFGAMGATGGPVSMLNNNVLANSDFITGAFPSDYGNGISGVFDLKMRRGNHEEHEFLGQVGFNGFELGAEGPLRKGSRASYLVNYRYSTLGVFSEMGIDFGTGTAVPQYQDLNVKLHFPSKKYGLTEVFALMGNSAVEFLDSETDEEEESGGFYSNNEDLRNRVQNGVAGISHQYFFDKNTYAKLSLALSGIRNKTSIDTFSLDGEEIAPNYRQNFLERTAQVHGFVNKKLNVHHVLRAGAFATYSDYQLNDSIFEHSRADFRTLRDFQGDGSRYQPYANWQYRISDEWEMNTGLHSLIIPEANTATVEPRWGMSYQWLPRHSFNLGYGLHSQAPSATIRYRESPGPGGQRLMPNREILPTKSHHFVLGYQWNMGKQWHFKAESYYQHIFDALSTAQASSYSNLNDGSFNFSTPDSAQNRGRGYNYGLDLTLERHLHEGFYFLSTLSLFESQYQGSDGTWRSTAFNGNYVWNILAGKEFVLKPNSGGNSYRHSLSLDGKFTTAGGQRYTPLDEAASRQQGQAVYDRERAFSQQFDPYLRADIRIGYKITGKKVTQEWGVDIQNITDQENSFGQRYNRETNEIETTNQLGIFPMFLYRITF